MHVALYKAKGLPFNWLVRTWQHSPYSHGEFVYYDKKTGKTYGLSSSMKDKGVRAKEIKFKKLKWDFIDITCLGLTQEKAMEETKKGQGFIFYDFGGVMQFGLGPVKQNPFKEFCTEFLARLLGWTQPWRFGPPAFAARIVDEVNKAKGNNDISIDGAGFVYDLNGPCEPEWAA
jgi:hypothetical protein